MSNHLAIATVTAALGQIALRAAEEAVPGTTPRFGRPPANANEKLVNIYLYNVGPHAGLRNADLPSRGGDGRLSGRPRAALVLHYLISFYGVDDLEPELMLGAVVRDLHARPVLTPAAIRDAIGSIGSLADSNLDGALESVAFTPNALSLEDMSRLWSVLVQTPHALSLTYEAAVVLIDAIEGVGPALPVLRRGPEDRGPEAQASAFPLIEALWIGWPELEEKRPRVPSLPSAQLGARLVFKGGNFGGDAVRLEFSHSKLGLTVSLPPDQADAGRLAVTLPEDAAAELAWAAGLYTVTVVATRGDRELRSASWPLNLAPRVAAIAPPSVVAGAATILTLTCLPHVRRIQRAFLLVAGQEIAAGPMPHQPNPDDDAPLDDSATIEFQVNLAKSADANLVILRIDGADSQPFLFDSVTGRLEFDAAQRIIVDDA